MRWTLPVPSTALLDGPTLEKRPGHEVAIQFTYESEDGTRRTVALVFEGVQAFKWTYLGALEDFMVEAYDRLVDRGNSAWLKETRTRLERRGYKASVVHLMITFDDGPCYEALCESFRVENE